ncbi:MAG: hypothetical protein A3A28_03315 [Candidatus Sungbacteria bacterium RIFCSPLOWO2_01_FULL_47_32]|uniref:Uncharacterized protein n=1 Tax=Candidatus Sungbacteria bacterium RIFCSPHIGHO2_01_FULL_47_32 TaxID=1802264 RepID=A0A1G2K5V7_9BACT|nr:MAG: hypothetical protein UX72_C0029G0005 [Parcubacteria group bacterium GW2011_GWA2_47_10]OGZ93860.1 MAG: hypothetical protein A2633_00115 [Candidatus Sungbacteria bacterium RIFCSPHIGHO2_01_FULL_47_32]OHA04529.1 MAG: hypothetical protein A3A28_03315 [Candidatus Sungbacteria bacterium RIFCSPLOWO2_01_FULL_47_32]
MNSSNVVVITLAIALVLVSVVGLFLPGGFMRRVIGVIGVAGGLYICAALFFSGPLSIFYLGAAIIGIGFGQLFDKRNRRS